MREIKTITGDEVNYLQNNKQSFICYVSEEELATFIDTNTLNPWFDEIPCIFLNSEPELRVALANMDTSTVKGKLEWIHVKTYLNGGRTLFRKLDSGRCELIADFNVHPFNQELNPQTPTFGFDGVNGLRILNLIQLYCPSELLTLTPSIHLQISIDGVVKVQQSVITLVHMGQVQASVGVINKVYHSFKKLEVKLLYLDENVQNPIHLQYK